MRIPLPRAAPPARRAPPASRTPSVTTWRKTTRSKPYATGTRAVSHRGRSESFGRIRNAIRYAKGQRGANLVEFPTTEVGDAEYFAERFGDIVRHDHRQGRWLPANDVGLWERDPVERLHQLVIVNMRERQRRALNIADADRRKKFLNWALADESRSRISNTLALARSVPPLNDRGDNWDPDPMLLGAPNGVVDLRLVVLRVAMPNDRVTMRVQVPYDPAATCPLWEKTVAEIFDNLAWAFVWRHGLERQINRLQVGMFAAGTRRSCPLH